MTRVPITERLPKESGYYVVWLQSDFATKCVCWFQQSINNWHKSEDNKGELKQEMISHWLDETPSTVTEEEKSALAWMKAQAKALSKDVQDDWGVFYLARVISAYIEPPSGSGETEEKQEELWRTAADIIRDGIASGSYTDTFFNLKQSFNITRK